MVFERIEKQRGNVMSIPPKEIVIGRGTISFGSEVLSWFGMEEHVEIYIDRELNKVGFKSTKNMVTGFKLQMNKKSGYVGAKAIRDLLPRGNFEGKQEKGFVVITVPEIVDNTKTVKVNQNE